MSSPARPLSGLTALVGVLGDPVRHSLSPAMHNAALRELGLDWAYLALPTPAPALATVLTALEARDCRGLNGTRPHKQAVAAQAAELSPLAERLGAVNTLVRRPAGGWYGTNTDVEGFLTPLRTPDPQRWRGSQALVLGCGGSARAVVAGLAELGLAQLTVAGRDGQRLKTFLADCGAWAEGLAGLAWGEAEASLGTPPLTEALASADLVVNTTPVGMASTGDSTAVERMPLTPAELERLRPGCTVYDLIYTPRPTTLLRRATDQGCHGIDGLEMLVHQGAAALRLWSGLSTVPVEAMRRAALTALTGALA